MTFIVISLDSFSNLGEALSPRVTDFVRSQLPEKARIWNLYGPAETTLDCTYHLVDRMSDRNSVPIGVPLPNYQCLVVDEFLQPVFVNQVGELLIGGVGVFAGYL